MINIQKKAKEQIKTDQKAFLYKVILYAFEATVSVTVFCMMFLKRIISCPPMNRTKGNNVLYLGIAFLGCFVICLLFKKIWKAEWKYNRRQFICIIMAASVFAYIIQLIILKCIWFETGWDVTCVYYDAVHRAEEGTLLGAHEYFTMHPNNVMLTFLFSVICRILHLAGLNNYYPILCCIGAFLVNIAGMLMFLIAFRLTKSIKTTVITWSIYTIFVSFSPWICVPYSDVYSMLFPISIFYLFLTKPEKTIWKAARWAGIGFLTVFGYEIKPTACIITIAIILIVCMTQALEKKWKQIVFDMFLLAVGFLLGGLFTYGGRLYIGFIADGNKAFPVAHYLMLGQNEDSYGVFNGEDWNFTVQFDTKEEKIKNELQAAKDRFLEKGLTGNIKFLLIKNMVNYDNGTFSWAYEGDFFRDVSAREDRLSVFLRNIYYPDGKYHYVYSVICQGIWILLLTGCIGIFMERPRMELAVAELAVLGLTLFLLIFESRARYLFLYMPMYVLLGGIGLKNIYLRIFSIYIEVCLHMTRYRAIIFKG